MSRWVALFAALLLLTPFAAQAQTAPVQVQFVGTITSSASDTLMVNGQRWTGPLPDYPYVTGDQITISYSATPTPGFLNPSYPVQPVDGIYRFTVASRLQTGGSELGIATLGSADVSGPIGLSGDWFGAQGMVLTYNTNTGTWGMEMPTGGYVLGEFDGPGFRYDPATNALAATSSTGDPRYRCTDQGSGCFLASGTMTTGGFNRVPVFTADGGLAGIFSVLFSGNWFVNGQQVGGGSTDVPEPGQTALFAVALMAVLLKTRRRWEPARA